MKNTEIWNSGHRVGIALPDLQLKTFPAQNAIRIVLNFCIHPFLERLSRN